MKKAEQRAINNKVERAVGHYIAKKNRFHGCNGPIKSL